MISENRVAKWHKIGHIIGVGVGMSLAFVYGMITPQPPNVIYFFAFMIGFELLIAGFFYIFNCKLFTSTVSTTITATNSAVGSGSGSMNGNEASKE